MQLSLLIMTNPSNKHIFSQFSGKTDIMLFSVVFTSIFKRLVDFKARQVESSSHWTERMPDSWRLETRVKSSFRSSSLIRVYSRLSDARIFAPFLLSDWIESL